MRYMAVKSIQLIDDAIAGKLVQLTGQEVMWNLLAKAVRHLPAEAAHRVAVTALHYNLGPWPAQPQSKIDLSVRLAGLKFANPLGLAAGFDKNATCFNGAMGLGFAHVEVGTITPKPQPGNPKPRVFRLPEENAVINRYGFNSNGMDAVVENLARNSKQAGRHSWGERWGQ